MRNSFRRTFTNEELIRFKDDLEREFIEEICKYTAIGVVLTYILARKKLRKKATNIVHDKEQG